MEDFEKVLLGLLGFFLLLVMVLFSVGSYTKLSCIELLAAKPAIEIELVCK